MIKLLLLTVLFISLSVFAHAETKWIDAAELGISGRYNVHDGYARMTDTEREKIKESGMNDVYHLSGNGSGLHVDFMTDSQTISVRYTRAHYLMDHMAMTGSGGMDLYILYNGKWNYAKTLRLPNQESEFSGELFSKKGTVLSKDFVDYSINLPLYNSVIKMEIGIDENAQIKPILYDENKAVLVYGSSITQGGCAARPGTSYSNYLRRAIDRDVINWGFSGSGKLENTIADIITSHECSLLIMDCVPNMTELDLKTFEERFRYFYTNYRKAHKTTPIIFMEHPVYTNFWLYDFEDKEHNLVLRNLFEEWSKTDKNIYKIKSTELYGTDHEATVDGTHATDLGFYRMSQPVIKMVKSVLKIK